MKKILFLLLTMSLFLTLGGCGGADPQDTSAPEETAAPVIPERSFTLDELAQYNGKDGNPAYVAVDGIVYDVSDVPAWSGGVHKGNQAGNDVTDIINSVSPHGTSVLKKLTPVGTLTE